jgi:plasmid stability protein
VANLSVKDVPDDLAERLRQRAARNHRSLQGELMAIIERAIAETEPAHAAPVAPRHTQPTFAGAGGEGRPVIRRGSKSIEQVAAEHRARFPQAIRSGPSAVDIIRAERDAR